MSGTMAREDTSEDVPHRGGKAASARQAMWAAVLGFAAIVAAAFWVALAPRQARPVDGRFSRVRLLEIDRPFPPGGRFASDPYIGSRSCAECHPGASALHARSGHARTLRPAGRLPLARRLDGTTVDDPESPGVRWTYRHEGGYLYIKRQAGTKVEECIAEYAFGSGHHATTFVSVIDPSAPSILEHRLTHYTREDLLALTPGHEIKPPPPGMTPYGGVPPPRDSRMCFECHATQLSAQEGATIDEATMILNVSCERCHGPGRAHVAAARVGAAESELTMPLGPGRWTAAALLQACGECHRHPAGPRPAQIRPDDPNTVRFQPIGLMQSLCYRRSEGALSCLTCHDAHARASSDRPAYNAACLSCHGGRDGVSPTAREEASPIRGAMCTVSPRERCVECHMPRVAVDAGRHVLLSDHWIRVRRAGEPTPADLNDKPGPGLPPSRGQ
jgi:hypothetical protein